VPDPIRGEIKRDGGVRKENSVGGPEVARESQQICEEKNAPIKRAGGMGIGASYPCQDRQRTEK